MGGPSSFDAERTKALVELVRELRRTGYEFVTVSPETHRRVNERAHAGGRASARSLRDVFGWSRPFARELLPPHIAGLALQARVLVEEGGYIVGLAGDDDPAGGAGGMFGDLEAGEEAGGLFDVGHCWLVGDGGGERREE